MFFSWPDITNTSCALIVNVSYGNIKFPIHSRPDVRLANIVFMDNNDSQINSYRF